MSKYKWQNLLLSITVLTILNVSCDKFKDVESGTPEQIVIKAAKFYTEKNPEKFLRLLSTSAIKKMDRSLQALRMQFKTLDAQYRKDLAEKMGINANSLTNLNMSDYVKFNMNLGSGGMGSDNVLFPVQHIIETDFLATEVTGSGTIVKYKDVNIYLVKEKNLWKINSFDILHEKIINQEEAEESR